MEDRWGVREDTEDGQVAASEGEMDQHGQGEVSLACLEN